VTSPATASFAEFARILGCRRGWVTQLRKDDRLVLTDDGKAVRVAESLARVRATRDGTRAGVAARHAAARAGAQDNAPPPPSAPDDAEAAPEADPEPSADAAAAAGFVDEGFQYWRRRGEKAKALAQERQNALAEGKLLDAGEVTASIASAVTSLRVRLETLPDTLGPQLAAIDDEARARALLAEAIEHVLEELSRQFAAVAKAEGAA